MASPEHTKDILEQLFNKNLSACVIGLLGGAITLLRGAKKSKIPFSIRQILASLAVSAFAAWLVSLILPVSMDLNYRAFVLGISGMSGERILSLLEEKGIKHVEKIFNADKEGK